MANMEDYANLLLGLTTLAKAPVAAYPESGAFLLAEQGQEVAKGKLADEALRKAQKKAKKKGKKNLIGKAVGTVGGSLLGGPTGGAVGGSLGSLATGGDVDPASIASSFADSAGATEGASQYGLLGKLYQNGKDGLPRTYKPQRLIKRSVLDPIESEAY